MTVGQLCRIALGLTGDGLDAQLVNLVCGGRREYHPVSQLREEGEPERIVLIHIQNAGNTHLLRALPRLPASGVIAEEAVYSYIQTGSGILFFVLFLAQTAFAAVSADVTGGRRRI